MSVWWLYQVAPAASNSNSSSHQREGRLLPRTAIQRRHAAAPERQFSRQGQQDPGDHQQQEHGVAGFTRQVLEAVEQVHKRVWPGAG
jgi:hypothetical protein